jgi:hypothetical protein
MTSAGAMYTTATLHPQQKRTRHTVNDTTRTTRTVFRRIREAVSKRAVGCVPALEGLDEEVEQERVGHVLVLDVDRTLGRTERCNAPRCG